MIRSLFTETGKIRYLQLFRTTILIAFFVVAFSMFLNRSMSVVNGSLFILYSTYVLFFIQILAMNYTSLKELLSLIKSFILKPIAISYSKTIIFIQTIIDAEYTLPTYKNKSFLSLCVIRC